MFLGKINIKLITINNERTDLKKRFQTFLLKPKTLAPSVLKLIGHSYSLNIKLSLKLALMQDHRV